jgi:hypothetical protein
MQTSISVREAILANVAAMESPRTVPDQAIGTGSQRIIDQMTATLDEVHSYTFEKLTEIENKITALKQAIVAQKNRSQQETQIYIETVDAALRTAEDLDRLVDDLERALPKSDNADESIVVSMGHRETPST